MFKIIVALGTFPAVLAASLPDPTGNYNVGIKKFEIPVLNTNDFLWPNNISTECIATIFYPTLAKQNVKKRPYLDPVTAQLYSDVYQFKNGTLASITEDFLLKDARPLKKSIGTLVFGSGAGGPPIEVYVTLLSDLASYGYTVIGLDHVYEQPFVRYPNGTGIIGLPIVYPWDLESIEAVYAYRLRDTSALIDYLPTLSKKFGASINRTHIGAFGHSLGGAAAVGSMQKDSRILSAINLDGTFWSELGEDSPSIDVKRPVLLFGNEVHLGGEESDASWGNFVRRQTGWWRQILVTGSGHLDFSDTAYWKTLPPWTASSFGSIEGKRMVKINRAVVKAFFDFTLLGKKEKLFDGPSSKFAELVYYAGGNGTA